MTAEKAEGGHDANASLKRDVAQENKNICPECGGPLRFGSRDPCEGDYYWCRSCGFGPIRFPLHHVMPKPTLIDADTIQALVRQEQICREIETGMFRDRVPFDPEKFVTDIVGS